VAGPDRRGGGALPWAWLTLDVVDPFCDPAPSEAEGRVFWVLALLRAAAEDLGRFLSRLDAGDGRGPPGRRSSEDRGSCAR
jgi:hypothetical protein